MASDNAGHLRPRRAAGAVQVGGAGGVVNRLLKRAFGESPRTTKLYDRTNDAISLDEIERILI